MKAVNGNRERDSYVHMVFALFSFRTSLCTHKGRERERDSALLVTSSEKATTAPSIIASFGRTNYFDLTVGFGLD